MLFNTKQILPPTDYLINFIDGTPVLKVDEFKYLGLLLHSQLSFRSHIDLVIKKISYDSKYFIFLSIALLIQLEKESLLS